MYSMEINFYKLFPKIEFFYNLVYFKIFRGAKTKGHLRGRGKRNRLSGTLKQIPSEMISHDTYHPSLTRTAATQHSPIIIIIIINITIFFKNYLFSLVLFINKVNCTRIRDVAKGESNFLLCPFCPSRSHMPRQFSRVAQKTLVPLIS